MEKFPTTSFPCLEDWRVEKREEKKKCSSREELLIRLKSGQKTMERWEEEETTGRQRDYGITDRKTSHSHL